MIRPCAFGVSAVLPQTAFQVNSMPVNMHDLLDEAASATARFLEDKLPSLTQDDWWERRVLQFLSTAQRGAVERNGITQLSGLDLSSLLHTLENNWRSLDDNSEFPPGSLNFVREMRSVRNQLSHRSAAHDPIPDDVYRDLDTLERFLSVINADGNLQEKVRADRITVAAEILKVHSPNVSEPIAPAEAPAQQVAAPEEPASPSCPVCGNAMVQRTVRTGLNAGNQFWGCSEWSVTGCNGIINIPKPADEDSEPPPSCPNCQSSMVLRTARTGPHAGSSFWGCSEWGITGCNGIVNVPQDETTVDVDDLPF